MGPCLPALGNQGSGLRGGTLQTPSIRQREPDARAGWADSPAPHLPAPGNQTLGQRGPTHLHPSTRLGEPDARSEGAYSPAPLYPPRGTRRSGRGGLLTCTPLPASGNQTLGQGVPTHLHPSTRLDLSHPRTPFLRRPPGPPGGTPTRPPAEPGTPTLKPGVLIRPNRTLQRTGPLVTPGEIYHWSPLIDLGFGRLASDFQGLDGSLPPRLREPDARAGGAYSRSPLYPPRPLSSPASFPQRAPLDLREGPLPVHQANPGIPHLSPGH